MVSTINGSDRRAREDDRVGRGFACSHGDESQIDEEAPQYAAAVIVGTLVDADIIDLMRRGFTVRPFRDLETEIASLILGQTTVAAPLVGRNGEERRTLAGGERAVVEKQVAIGESGIRASAERTYDGEFASQICAQLDPLLTNGPIREFFHLCARKTRKRFTVDEAAEAAGIGRQQLTTTLQDAGYPGPDDVIRWFRLLHAVWLLSRTPRRSVDAVAKALSYASGPSLSNAMKHAFDMRPTELAKHGGLSLALAQFRRRLRDARPAEPHTEPLPATS